MIKIRFHKIKHKRYKYTLSIEYNIGGLNLFLPPIESDYFEFYIKDKMSLRILIGYCWDGCTGAPDFKSSMRASLVHDVFYQCFRERLLDPKQYRKYADKLFHQILLEDDMNRALARCYYIGVRVFGRFSARGNKDRMNPPMD